MKAIPALLILCCASVAVWSGAATGKTKTAEQAPYKLKIALPAGFAADDDPFMTRVAYYVFTDENGDALGSKGNIRFLKRPHAAAPMTQADRAALLNTELADLRGSHEGYGESPSYELEAKQLTYTCADWQGSSFGSDFAGFVCVAAFEGKPILVEAQDLAANQATTLPQLKDSLKAATYAK
jgi:hypothetical protein